MCNEKNSGSKTLDRKNSGSNFFDRKNSGFKILEEKIILDPNSWLKKKKKIWAQNTGITGTTETGIAAPSNQRCKILASLTF